LPPEFSIQFELLRSKIIRATNHLLRNKIYG